MKLNDPRFVLAGGLSLAIGLAGSAPAFAADSTANKTVKKSVRLVQSQTNPGFSTTPVAPTPGLPPLSGTPLAPIPSPQMDNSGLVPQPQPLSSGPSMMTAPTPLNSQPALSPANRPPMGMFYGEQDQLDTANNRRPRPLPTVPYPGPNSGVPFESQGTGVPVESAPIGGEGPNYSVTDRFGYAPPPGTLGQTYKRRSRLIEDKKHPRVAAVEVNLPEGVDVTAEGLKSKWTGKVWRLESDPLIPGVPHIYEVKASWGEGTDPQYRTIRLIMGRIVDLDF